MASTESSIPLQPNMEKAMLARPPITIMEYIASRSPLIKAIMKKVLTLRQVLLLSDGRDKVLKVIQYFSKAFLWAYSVHCSQMKRGAITTCEVGTGNCTTTVHPTPFKYEKNINSMIAQFSLTRKLLRLMHVVEPTSKIYTIPLNFTNDGSSPHQRLMTTLNIIDAMVVFCNDISDDIVCLSKIGVIDSKYSSQWSPVSARLWMIGIWLDLHASFQRLIKANRDMAKAEEKEEVLRLIRQKNQCHYDNIKLLFDLIFCIGDCWPEVYPSPGVQAVTGTISGAMSLLKMWRNFESRL